MSDEVKRIVPCPGEGGSRARDGLRIIECPSPNRGPRRGTSAPDMVVIHYTGMRSTEEALARLRDPASEVSAHYLIAPGGEVFRLVPEADRAWHAGVAFWGGIRDVNSHSIGVELANPGPLSGTPPFPEPQIRALEALLSDIMTRRRILPERVVGHACVAPERKADPGPAFDWRRLAQSGLAIWLDPEAGAMCGDGGGPADAHAFQTAARRFGYGVPGSGSWCAGTLAVWRAFLARFLPARCGTPPFAAGVRHLARLAARWPAA